MKPASRTRVSVVDRVTEEVRSAILAGVHKPNTFLPTERRLALAFGVSRRTITTALDRLAAERLVVQDERRGTRVLPLRDRLSRSHIGIVMQTTSIHNEGGRLLLAGVQDALQGVGQDYIHAPMGVSRAESEKDSLRKYAALIFLEGGELTEELFDLQRRGVPFVVANMEEDLDLPATWVDREKVTRDAMRILLALGHRRIALLIREPEYVFYGKMQGAYLAALEEAGIPRDDSLIVTCNATNGIAAYTATRPLLALNPPPTAIVAGRDSLAQGACQAIADAGLTIGHEISVIGFDDNSWPEGRSMLTTFREPMYEMGAAAVEMLMAKIAGRGQTPEKQEFPVSFILRRSVGPPAENGATLSAETSGVALRVLDELI